MFLYESFKEISIIVLLSLSSTLVEEMDCFWSTLALFSFSFVIMLTSFVWQADSLRRWCSILNFEFIILQMVVVVVVLCPWDSSVLRRWCSILKFYFISALHPPCSEKKNRVWNQRGWQHGGVIVFVEFYTILYDRTVFLEGMVSNAGPMHSTQLEVMEYWRYL